MTQSPPVQDVNHTYHVPTRLACGAQQFGQTLASRLHSRYFVGGIFLPARPLLRQDTVEPTEFVTLTRTGHGEKSSPSQPWCVHGEVAHGHRERVRTGPGRGGGTGILEVIWMCVLESLSRSPCPRLSNNKTLLFVEFLKVYCTYEGCKICFFPLNMSY